MTTDYSNLKLPKISPIHVILVLFIILAFWLRLLPILNNAVSFHYDMGRDAFIAEQIWKDHDLKIQGPPTSTPGLYHGALYYYLIAIGYFIGDGNPIFAAIELALLNSLTIIPIYMLVKDVFNRKSWGLLAAFLFAISFEAIQFAPWISNPAPVEFTLAWFFYGLFLWSKKQEWGFLIAILSAALSAQFQFFFVYLLVVIPTFGWLFKLSVSRRMLLRGILMGLIILSSFLISFYKFGTINSALNGFFQITSGSDLDFRSKFSDDFIGYFNKFADIYINNFFPVNVFIGGLLAISSLMASYKNKFIFFLLLSNIPIYFFGGHNSNYANIGMVTPAILSFILLLRSLVRYSWIYIFIFIFLSFISNIYMDNKFAVLGQTTLAVQDDMTIGNEKRLVDKTYELSQGDEFGINSLTLPLWTNTTWAYLYKQYGLKKYGYLPCFYGRDPIGQLGEKVFKRCEVLPDKLFYIMEPPNGINGELYTNEINSENAKTFLVKEYQFNTLKLQQRSPLLKM